MFGTNRETIKKRFQITPKPFAKPNDAVIYSNRADARDKQGDHQGALSDYNEALRLKPYADTYNSRATRYRLEDYKGAMPIAFFNSLTIMFGSTPLMLGSVIPI